MSWENDDRGRPCKWQVAITVTRQELAEHGLSAQRQEEILRAMTECRQALRELGESAERYVVRVEPELVWHDTADGDARIYTTRCRVRWCADDATIEKYRELGGCLTAAEFAKGNPLVEKTERARLENALAMVSHGGQ